MGSHRFATYFRPDTGYTISTNTPGTITPDETIDYILLALVTHKMRLAAGGLILYWVVLRRAVWSSSLLQASGRDHLAPLVPMVSDGLLA